VGLKRPGHEADHSPPSSAKVKNVWSYTSTTLTSLWHGTYLTTETTLPVLLADKVNKEIFLAVHIAPP
jgi:hypothetical protein